MANQKRPLTAEDLYDFQIITDSQISPDGQHVMLAVQRVDQKTEKKYSNLWLFSTEGKPSRQFTYGDQVDNMPRWSPDGRSLAFLSNRRDAKQSQIYIIPIDGGEARPLTDMKGSFASFEWSPDGTQLVCQFRKKDQDALEREEDEQKKKLGVVSRHITSVFYKWDGQGYLPKEKWHIWTIDADGGEITQLTDGDCDENDPTWSPDGQSILFVSNRDPEPDLNLEEDELYLIPARGGEMRQIPAHSGSKFLARFSPDGRSIAYLGNPLKYKWYQNNCLYMVPAEGGEARNLTAPYDLHLSNATLNDMGTPPLSPPTWSADSQRIYFTVVQRGNTSLLALSLEGEQATIEPIIAHEGVTSMFNMDQAQQKVAYLYGDLWNTHQLCVRDIATSASTASPPLTEFNKKLLNEIEFGQIEEVCFKNKAGQDLSGWILTPPGFDPQQKYPSILEIHGGPQTQYGRTFMHEFHYLAAQGYVVYWTNPRGSQGYGEEFAGAIYNRWGTVDFDDVMSWVDYITLQPYIDQERMGVTGGSYGGYMTTMIIGRSPRFKAAVAQRIVSNLISMWGTSDFNHGTSYLVGLDMPPWENVQKYWEHSPLKYIGNARTPTLIIHSEKDYRCNQEQAEQAYIALKRLGVDTELVLFPNEPHGLSRMGRTDRRIARLKHIARWFNQYLSPEK
ncbi:MAG: S9 family peptidase [Ardenticatenaceae bacterium]